MPAHAAQKRLRRVSAHANTCWLKNPAKAGRRALPVCSLRQPESTQIRRHYSGTHNGHDGARLLGEMDLGGERMSGLFGRLRAGLSRSSKALGDSLGGLLGGSRLSAEQLDALEDLLIMADLGVEAAGIVAALRQRKDLKDLDEAELRAALATEIAHCWPRPSTRLTCPAATRRA